MEYAQAKDMKMDGLLYGYCSSKSMFNFHFENGPKLEEYLENSKRVSAIVRTKAMEEMVDVRREDIKKNASMQAVCESELRKFAQLLELKYKVKKPDCSLLK